MRKLSEVIKAEFSLLGVFTLHGGTVIAGKRLEAECRVAWKCLASYKAQYSSACGVVEGWKEFWTECEAISSVGKLLSFAFGSKSKSVFLYCQILF